MNFPANPFLPGLCRYACLLGLYCESGKWILYFFDEYGWFSTLSLLKRPFHSKAQGLQVGGRVSQLLRLAGGHLPNKDCPALPAAPQCPAPRLPPATPSAPPPRSGHRHREPGGHTVPGTGHRYRTTGKARWHCGRRSTSLILSFRQLLSPATAAITCPRWSTSAKGRISVRSVSDDFFPDFNFCLCWPPPGKYEGSKVNFVTNHSNFQIQHWGTNSSEH